MNDASVAEPAQHVPRHAAAAAFEDMTEGHRAVGRHRLNPTVVEVFARQLRSGESPRVVAERLAGFTRRWGVEP